MNTFFILLCLIAATFAEKYEVHKHMTSDEVQEIFGTDHAGVPEYEVVPVKHTVHARSNNHRIVQLTSFERQMKLYLEPVDGHLAGVNTPVFRARANASAESGIEFERVHEAVNPKHHIFQDPYNLAAVLIEFNKRQQAMIQGIIDMFAIRPLPSRFHRGYRQKRDVEDEDEHPHIIYKLGHKHKELVAMKNAKRPRVRTINAVPQVIYPQIMVMVESTYFELFKKDVAATVRYLLAFWNGIDLRYRVFLNPDIRINIAGIILAEDPEVTPYIVNNRVQVEGFDYNKIEVVNTLESNAHFMYPETSFNKTDQSLTMRRLGFNFDLVITMTKYDMCEFSQKCLLADNYVCGVNERTIKSECVTLGFAFYTGACAYDPDSKVMEAVGIVEDQGAFAAVIPTAHEVGHLLGASHSDTNQFGCPIDDGYIMSYQLTVTEQSFMWSNCSAFSIKAFLKDEKRAQCLFNKPNTGNEKPRILPGEVLSRDEQCQRVMGTKSCRDPKKATNCVRLYCLKDNKSAACTNAPFAAVPEGTTCGRGKYCINGECRIKTEGLKKNKQKVLLQLGTEAPKTDHTEDYDYDAEPFEY